MGNYVIARLPFGTEGHTQGVFGESFDIEKQDLVILATGDKLKELHQAQAGAALLELDRLTQRIHLQTRLRFIFTTSI